MADQLYLSYWLRNYSEPTMLRHYEKLLRLFPFSRLGAAAFHFKCRGGLQRAGGGGDSVSSAGADRRVLAVAKDFQNADACYRLETWWDLWQFETEWKLSASARRAVLFWS